MRDRQTATAARRVEWIWCEILAATSASVSPCLSLRDLVRCPPLASLRTRAHARARPRRRRARLLDLTVAPLQTRCAMLAEELENPASRIRATAWIDKLSVTAGVPGRAARLADPYIEQLLTQLDAGVLLAPFDVPVPDGPLPRMVAASATHLRGRAGRHSPGRKLAAHQQQQQQWARRRQQTAWSMHGRDDAGTGETSVGAPRGTPQGTPRVHEGGLLEKRLMASVSPKRAKPAPPTELIAETARWVVQNGKGFEDMLKETNRGNPLWTFLLEPNSAPAQLYRDRLQHERRRRVTERKAAAARERKKERDAAELIALERRDTQLALQNRRKERAEQRLKLQREEEVAELVARKQERQLYERLQQEEQAKVDAERRQAEELAAQQKAELKLQRQEERAKHEHEEALRKAECEEELQVDAEATAELLDRTQVEQRAIFDEAKAEAMNEAVRSVVASPDEILQQPEQSEDFGEREAEERTWKDQLVAVRRQHLTSHTPV